MPISRSAYRFSASFSGGNFSVGLLLCVREISQCSEAEKEASKGAAGHGKYVCANLLSITMLIDSPPYFTLYLPHFATLPRPK